jgi:hypothetical protein
MKSAWHCTDFQTVTGAVGPPTGRGVEAENPPTVTARSTVGAGTFVFRSSAVFAEHPHWQASEKQVRETALSTATAQFTHGKGDSIQ